MDGGTEGEAEIRVMLAVLIVISVVERFFLKGCRGVFLKVLALVLFVMPRFVSGGLKIAVPINLRAIVLVFVFSTRVLKRVGTFCMGVPM